MIDIANLSLVELKELERQVPREIRRRVTEDRVKVRRELEALAQARGFSLNDVVTEARPKQVRGTVAAKYRSKLDPKLSWSGRGRKPGWVETWLANGGTLDQIAI
ncbi:MAG: H-NS histone family protein [Zoogloeaceae bacterium]|jgi:DNA-binding protein H-NS|nr:H-NS histone family protein [Zoogloeaceae bacterium]